MIPESDRTVFCLVRMEVAETDRIFQLVEGSFDGPSGKIQALQQFWREFVRYEIGDEAFISIIGNREPDDTQGQGICIQSPAFDNIKGGILVDKAVTVAGYDQGRLAPGERDIHGNIKGFFFGENEIANQPFGMDILGAEKEELS